MRIRVRRFIKLIFLLTHIYNTCIITISFNNIIKKIMSTLATFKNKKVEYDARECGAGKTTAVITILLNYLVTGQPFIYIAPSILLNDQTMNGLIAKLDTHDFGFPSGDTRITEMREVLYLRIFNINNTSFSENTIHPHNRPPNFGSSLDSLTENSRVSLLTKLACQRVNTKFVKHGIDCGSGIFLTQQALSFTDPEILVPFHGIIDEEFSVLNNETINLSAGALHVSDRDEMSYFDAIKTPYIDNLVNISKYDNFEFDQLVFKPDTVSTSCEAEADKEFDTKDNFIITLLKPIYTACKNKDLFTLIENNSIPPGSTRRTANIVSIWQPFRLSHFKSLYIMGANIDKSPMAVAIGRQFTIDNNEDVTNLTVKYPFKPHKFKKGQVVIHSVEDCVNNRYNRSNAPKLMKESICTMLKVYNQHSVNNDDAIWLVNNQAADFRTQIKDGIKCKPNYVPTNNHGRNDLIDKTHISMHGSYNRATFLCKILNVMFGMDFESLLIHTTINIMYQTSMRSSLRTKSLETVHLYVMDHTAAIGLGKMLGVDPSDIVLEDIDFSNKLEKANDLRKLEKIQINYGAEVLASCGKTKLSSMSLDNIGLLNIINHSTKEGVLKEATKANYYIKNKDYLYSDVDQYEYMLAGIANKHPSTWESLNGYGIFGDNLEKLVNFNKRALNKIPEYILTNLTDKLYDVLNVGGQKVIDNRGAINKEYFGILNFDYLFSTKTEEEFIASTADKIIYHNQNNPEDKRFRGIKNSLINRPHFLIRSISTQQASVIATWLGHMHEMKEQPIWDMSNNNGNLLPEYTGEVDIDDMLTKEYKELITNIIDRHIDEEDI